MNPIWKDGKLFCLKHKTFDHSCGDIYSERLQQYETKEADGST